MNQAQSRHELFEEIRREHEELRELLGGVKHMLGKRLETVASVAEMLASLGEHVETHFAEEETAGVFDDIVDQAPHLADRIESLRIEHQQLLAAVRRLNEVAAPSDSSDDWWQSLEAAFHEFSSGLMHHETAENEVLLEAYTDDIGAAD